MTHHILNSTTLSQALELLTDTEFEGMANALKLLMNEAMKLERSQFLETGP